MIWRYNDKEIKSHADLHEDCTDIVYLITYTSGHRYIGKRTVRSMSVLPLLKTKSRENATVITRHILRDEQGKIITGKASRKEARNRGLKAKAEKYEVLTTDKPFMKYEGSSELTRDYKVEKKEILYQCSNKKTATYLEAATLFRSGALFTDIYLNANILGSFYDNSMDGLIKEK